ncbi:metallophosphoesterase [Echinicola sp. CAU 1574]|uniref:Metallophosphoesterase n=1 Tax=Echinicola arenosa TaxID=2774144 RepID=A0ABR9ANL5_9BACT|nr:metallophosphoesterase [Echinicola arenosa]MBD8489500.1 metallophosphoesterase [Echinicola arenosa]
MDRKEFIKIGALGTLAMSFSPLAFSAEKKDKKVRFGIITDLHYDIMHNGQERISAFISKMNEDQPDFIIQLGDFCVPKPENQSLLDTWNKFPGEKYHVIGNHDTDGGFNRDQVVEFWDAKAKYYSFDKNGFHFVVLDGNEHNESPNRPKGYARYISPDQLEWLEKDLSQTSLPTIVFCHQGLDNEMAGIENGMPVRYALEKANKEAEFQKVILVLSGHHHQDYYNHINDIHYVQINSASYYWLGDKYKTIRYSKEVDETNPWIKYTAPYKDPLWAMVEISQKGKIFVEGRKTSWVGPSPEEMEIPSNQGIYPIVSEISNRDLKI